jgi:hypothetical protein
MLSNKWYFPNFLITLIAFLLIKDIAVGLALIPIGLLTVNSFIGLREGGSNFKNSASSATFKLAIALGVTYLTRLIWTTYSNGGKVDSSAAIFDGPSKISQLNNLGTESIQIRNTILERIATSEVITIETYPFTYVDWFAIFIVLSILAVIANGNKLGNYFSISSGLVLLFGFIFYLLILYLSYLTVFDGRNASTLTSFDRYFGTYLMGGIIFFALRSADELYRISDFKANQGLSTKLFFMRNFPVMSIYLVALIFIFDNSDRLSIYINKPSDYSTRVRIPFKDLSERFEKAGFKPEDKVWVITQHRHGFEFFLLKYELLPASVPPNPFSIGTPYNSEDIWTDTSMTKEKWDATLNDFDFVVVFNSTQTFIDEFGSLFEDPESLNAQGIYRVVHGTSGNLLVAYK